LRTSGGSRQKPEETQAFNGMRCSVVLTRPTGTSVASVGAGVREIRIHVLGESRVICISRFAGAVFVLHCLEKKSRRIRREDLELVRQRYRLIR
jgi:phage-related protein